MRGQAETVEDYGHLWQGDGSGHRWTIWNTAGQSMVFDRETNCPAEIDDTTVLREVLRRMREAGVPESDEYPGRPCGQASSAPPASGIDSPRHARASGPESRA